LEKGGEKINIRRGISLKKQQGGGYLKLLRGGRKRCEGAKRVNDLILEKVTTLMRGGVIVGRRGEEIDEGGMWGPVTNEERYDDGCRGIIRRELKKET